MTKLDFFAVTTTPSSPPFSRLLLGWVTGIILGATILLGYFGRLSLQDSPRQPNVGDRIRLVGHLSPLDSIYGDLSFPPKYRISTNNGLDVNARFEPIELALKAKNNGQHEQVFKGTVGTNLNPYYITWVNGVKRRGSNGFIKINSVELSWRGKLSNWCEILLDHLLPETDSQRRYRHLVRFCQLESV